MTMPRRPESQLEMLLRQRITLYILRNEMEGFLGSRFIDELALEIADALREDAKALGDAIAKQLAKDL